MSEAVAYEVDTVRISMQKMQFTVNNHRPKYPNNHKDTVKAEVERQLFEIFKKYL